MAGAPIRALRAKRWLPQSHLKSTLVRRGARSLCWQEVFFCCGAASVASPLAAVFQVVMTSGYSLGRRSDHGGQCLKGSSHAQDRAVGAAPTHQLQSQR